MEAYILYVIMQVSSVYKSHVEASQMEFASKETCEYAMNLLIEEKAKEFYKFDAFCFKK